jgi:hypothetical protein
MERKDYAEKLMEIKNEILKEIRKAIPFESAHHFAEKFYVHYVEGEVATTEICSAVEVCSDGTVVFIVKPENADKEEVIKGETVFMYDPESFLDILDHLKKEVREKKLSHLREIVKQNGGRMEFDGNFTTRLPIDGEELSVGVDSLYFDEDDCFCIGNHHCQCYYSDQCDNLLSDELDRIIAYVKSKTKRKFVIRVSGSYSRTFDIEASSYEEALAEAKKDWEINPLRYDDSNGEDWEDYTSRAH